MKKRRTDRRSMKMCFLIPENLNIDELIERYKGLYMGMKLSRDKLLYICHTLICVRAAHRKEMLYKKTTYTPLNAVELHWVLNNDYKRAIDFFLKASVIETNNHYIVGEKSKGYRFHADYGGQKIKKVNVDSFALKRAIRRYTQRKIEKNEKQMRGYKYLTKWWDADRLKIDKLTEIKWLESHYDNKLKNALENERQEIIETCEDFKTMVTKFSEGDFKLLNFGRNNHRLYSYLTGIKKELRNFITFDDQPLVNLDLKNSQPYMALRLFRPGFWGLKNDSNLKLNKIDKILWNKIIKDNKRMDNIIMIIDSLEKQYSKGFQVSNNFKDLVLGGKIYEFLMKELQDRFPDRFSDRSTTKQEVLRIMYYDPAKEKASFYDSAKAFERLFPNEFAMFRAIKMVDRYNALPILLQKIESYLIIDCVCKNIAKAYPEAPLFTIHDSIATVEEYVDIVKTEMEEVLTTAIGYTPSVENEYLNNDTKGYKQKSTPAISVEKIN